jgi:MerR family transcriptional regulator, copper efflux regulator
MSTTAEHDPTLRTGEVAELAGVNPKTIRYHQGIGLIPEPARRTSGYRVYGAEDVERIAFIKGAQRFGLSWDEIRDVLSYREQGRAACEFVLSAVRRHAEEVEQRITELTQLREELGELIDRAADARGTPGRNCRLLDPHE